MKLEPYTVPEQDADLWSCGVVLDPSPPVDVRAANDRPTGRDQLVWAVMCKHETATFAEIVKFTKTSPRRVGTSLLRLAALGTVRPVGEVDLCSNNGVSVRSRWMLCGPEERQAAGAEWRARVWQEGEPARQRQAKEHEEYEERVRRLHMSEAQRSARTLEGSLEGYVIRVFFEPNEPGAGPGEVFPELLAVAEVEKRREAGAVVVAVYPDRYGPAAEALAAMLTADRKRRQRRPSPPKPKLSAEARAALRAEAAADAKASEERAEERQRQDELEASTRARINGWTP